MLGRVRCEITKPQPRLKGDRQLLLQPVWDYGATTARSALELTPGGRRLDGRRANVPDQLRDLRRTDSAPLDHVRDSVRKSYQNTDRAVEPAGEVLESECEK